MIEEKQKDLDFEDGPMTEDRIRLREEISEQIRALSKMKEMAASYGVDISKPAKNAKEAVQSVYMGYLAGTKENNGAATSLGRTSTFLDIYIERDLKNGVITETEAQELIDQFIIKLRLTRHLRTPEYDELFFFGGGILRGSRNLSVELVLMENLWLLRTLSVIFILYITLELLQSLT